MIGCQSRIFWAQMAHFGCCAQLYFLGDSRKPRNLLSGEGQGDGGGIIPPSTFWVQTAVHVLLF